MRYEFADCLLDTESFKLFRNGAAQPVEPQVFDLLRVLAENAGKLVSRDHLIEEVWDGRIVSEATISARINAARTAVGDDGKAQAIIRTVPRRGIELVVPVRSGADPVDAAPSPVSRTKMNQTIRYTTSADGTQLAYAISGNVDGMPLLRASHHVSHLELEWNSSFYRPTFDALGERHKLIRFDIRGAGLSDRAGDDHDIQRHVEDLVAVADSAGLERFAILANLNSAPVSIRFASENPDRISRLVIQGGYARGRALRGGKQSQPGEDPFISLLHGSGWGDPQNGYMRAWATMAVPTLSYEDATRFIELIAGACSGEDALHSRVAIDRFDARDRMAEVKTPTLVIHPRNDSLHPLAEARMIAAGIPGAEFHVVESANTICLAPDPTWAEQIGAILEFLARD
ncbi:winged helix-turn-helix domain-containing protein [Nioella sp.]|uniref:winged helix-turn-helix domain-containing protein n=1 Tax=Nioella sp. TaxID=1912091 RepID=UPI003B517BAD